MINLIFMIFAVTVAKASGDIGNLTTGDCNKIKNLDRWLHFLINMLGSILVETSNYNMQCLSSPTRKEVDRTHWSKQWLDIGVSSVRNLRFISRRRVILWLIFAISTIPLHLLWNSAIFSTFQANDYVVIVVTPDFLTASSPSCSDPPRSSYSDVVCNMYRAAHDSTNLTRLEPSECIKEYGINLQSRWSNVIVVTKTANIS